MKIAKINDTVNRMNTIRNLIKNTSNDDEYLLRFALKLSPSDLLLNLNKQLTKSQLSKFNALKKLRARNVPMQYIVGEAWFFGLKFAVNKNVLIPRPESELIVERALSIATEHPTCSVIDVGTGSGAIAIAIAKNSNMSVSAIDISSKTLAVARKNAKTLNARIKFSKSDVRKLTKLPKTAHIIVTANLPYLSDRRMKRLSAEVKKEPKLALYGGPDGLDLYRTMLHNLFKFKNQTIHALLEIDPEQKTKLATFVRREFPKSELIFYPDLHGDIRLAEITF